MKKAKSFSELKARFKQAIAIRRFFLNRPQNKHIILSVICFLIYGLTPFFWHHIKHLPNEVIIFYRFLGCAFLLFPFALNFSSFSFKKYYVFIPVLFITGGLNYANWSLYTWAVNHGFVLEAGLSYFVSPVFSIFLATFFLKEKLKFNQTIGFFIIIFAIMLKFLESKDSFGLLLSLMIAATFSLYGFISKRLPIPFGSRLFLETGIVSFGILIFDKRVWSFFSENSSAFYISEFLGCGFVTALPIAIYIISIKKMPFSYLSVLQYITPTMIFLEGIFYFKQSFSIKDAYFFALIWSGVFLFLVPQSLRLFSFKKANS